MKRQSSFTIPSSEVSRNIDNSSYDVVKTVADNIADVVAAGANIGDIQALAVLDLDSIGQVASYINDVVTVSAADAAIKANAADLALGAESNILTAAANAEIADLAAKSAAQSAIDSANSASDALVATASKLTTVAYTVTPEDTYVKKYDVVDGLIVETETTDYSAYHYRKKAEYAAIGSAESILTNTITEESGATYVDTNTEKSLENLAKEVDDQTAVLGMEIWQNSINHSGLKFIGVEG